MLRFAQSNFCDRQVLLRVGLPFMATAIGGIALWYGLVRHPEQRQEAWLVRLDADAPRTSAHWIEDLERRGQPEMAQGVRDQIAMEELLRVPVWGENELEVMLAYERLWPVDAVRPPNANRELQRRQGTSTDAAFTMATRLEYRGPVTPEVRERIKQVLLERSKGVDRYTRHSAATQLSHSGLWREPEVWARLQQMTRDPEPMVAAQARRIVHRLTARLEREAQQP